MKASGDRPEREPESATFEPVRVRGHRGHPPVVALAFVAVLAGVVAVGIGGRTPPGATLAPLVAAVSPVASPGAVSAKPFEPVATLTATPAPTRPMVTGGLGGPLELQIRRPAASIFVHGDVFALKVTWVFISLQDAAGEVKGWASVSIPGAAVPGAIDGPSLRFDVDVAVPPDLHDRPVWVQAVAYDATGKVVGTTRVGIQPDGTAVTFSR